MVQCPRRASAQHYLIDSKHHRARIKPLAHPGFKIARAVKLVVEPALLERFGVSRKLVTSPASGKRVDRRLRSEHSGFDRAMTAFDARCIEKTGVVSD